MFLESFDDAVTVLLQSEGLVIIVLVTALLQSVGMVVLLL